MFLIGLDLTRLFGSLHEEHIPVSEGVGFGGNTSESSAPRKGAGGRYVTTGIGHQESNEYDRTVRPGTTEDCKFEYDGPTGEHIISKAGRRGVCVVRDFSIWPFEDTVQALMDLSLPRFTRLEDGRLPKNKLWPITEQPPSSPASVRDGLVTRTPSPCYQLDDLTSASSTGGTGTNDYRLSLLTDSSLSVTPVGSIVSFSDDDLPLDSDGVQKRDVIDDAPPGSTDVPEYIPQSAQKPVEDPVYTPTPRDRPVMVPGNKVPPADDVMFDPMLGEWPVDTLSSPE